MSPDGSLFVTGATRSGEEINTKKEGMIMWDVASGRMIRSVGVLGGAFFGGAAGLLAFSGSGKRLGFTHFAPR